MPRNMPRNYKLTWQVGIGKRNGRWRKKYKGRVYYFSGGRGRSDRSAYDAALNAWEELKVRIDAETPKPYQRDYEKAIHEWETVLAWCHENGDDEMSRVAVAKQGRLRTALAVAKPYPLPREDTFDGQFEQFVPDAQLTDAISETLAAFTCQPMPEDTPMGRAYNAARERLSQVDLGVGEIAEQSAVVPGDFDLDSVDSRTVEKEIWRDRLEVMQRSSVASDQSTHAYARKYLDEKRALVDAQELTPNHYDTLQRLVNEFTDWFGHQTPVTDIGGKTLSDYRIEVLRRAGANGWAAGTAKDRVDRIKSFIRWLWQIEAIPNLPRNMDSRSSGLKISTPLPTVIVFEKPEITILLKEASERTQLYILLMLNCGMTQKDIADLNHSEVDWERGRITRKRSKTRGFENVPEVSYTLWGTTLTLLQNHRTDSEQGAVLLNEKGNPLRHEEVQANGKLKKNDNIRNAFSRLQRKTGITKPLKSLKKTSASLIRNDPRYASLESLFLGHAPQSMSDKHYTVAPQALLDDAVIWLSTEYGLSGGETVPGET